MSYRPIPSPGAVTGTTSTDHGSDWRERAACRYHDPDLWFAADGERANRRNPRVAEAKAICATCPVRTECGAEAETDRIPYGVWGGLDEDERARTLRKQGRQRTRGRPPALDPAKVKKALNAPTVRPTCGSDPGYRAHTNATERQCDACRTWKASVRAKPCGTAAAYRRHIALGQEPCDPCRAAKATESAEYRARNRRGNDEQAA